ncbi:CysS/YqeB C-terminal domain-containing protein, partial [Micromonospora sp. WMMD723]
PAGFVAAMNDDLNTSAALAVLQATLRDGNTALAEGDDVTVRTTLAATRAMLDILGVDPLDPAWTGGGRADDLRGVVDSLVALALEQRAQARSRKDWAAADAVRDQLKQSGVVVEDTPQGPRWTIGEQD